jgi:hypothetical protein
MDTATIILGIGVLISLVLGVINLLARREKVAVVNSQVYLEFLPKGTSVDGPGGYKISLNYAALSIEASCELVLTRGEKELEVKEVEVILDKKTCENLKRYFRIPLHNRLQLYHINAYEGEPLPQPIVLETKKTLRFKRIIPFDCTDEFETEYEKMEGGSYPEFVQPLLDELETKYHICWTRYDGKRLCWRFPQKWWRNLGKRLWG